MLDPIWADVKEMLRDEDFFIWTGVLCISLIAAAFIFRLIQVWRRRITEPEKAEDSLGSYRSMLENGELTPEEYRRILDRVAQRIKGKPVPQAPPVQPSQPNPPEASPPDRPI